MRAVALLSLLLVPGAAAKGSIFEAFVRQHLAHAKAALRAGKCPFSGKEQCGECTEKVAKHIAEEAMAKMMATCDAGKGCPHACWQLKEDPQVMLGVLIMRLKPVELAEMYCAGKGLCAQPEIAHSHGFHGKAMKMLLKADAEDFGEVIEKAKELENDTEPRGGHKQGKMPSMWGLLPRGKPQCMHKFIEKIMDRAEARMEASCKSEDALACKFRSENPAVFRGMLLGKVEPWKFAMGYCAPHPKALHPIGAALRWAKRAVGVAAQERKERAPLITV